MLEDDYSSRFSRLIESVKWDIELPRDWTDYFDHRGETSSFNGDVRSNKRMMVRTYGLMWTEESLSFCHRSAEPIGIYTRDFSRQGVGLLTPFQIYPEERIRVVLPAFWVELSIVRARRITNKCYEVGAELLQRHDPDPKAFAPATAALSSSH